MDDGSEDDLPVKRHRGELLEIPDKQKHQRMDPQESKTPQVSGHSTQHVCITLRHFVYNSGRFESVPETL